MTLRALGRRQPDAAHAEASLTIGDYMRFRAVGLTPPDSIDHFSRVSDWGMYGNDLFNDCGPTSAANMRKMVSLYVNGTEQSPSQDDVFALYRLQNPDFDPQDPQGPGDGGVDMQTMCEHLVKVGIGGVKALGFGKVNVNDLAELHEAVTLFGSLLLGVNLTRAQETQTENGQPWNYVASSAEWGRHAVLYGSYNPTLDWVISWAQAIGMTQLFDANAIEEAWAVIWPENLQVGAFMRGIDLHRLAADYKLLTGRKFPVDTQPVDPAPVDPTPVPDPAPPAPEPDPAPAPAPVPSPPVDPTPVDPPLSGFEQRLADFLKEVQADASQAVADAMAAAEQRIADAQGNLEQYAGKLAAQQLADVRPLVDNVLQHAGALDDWLKQHGV